MEMIRKWNFNTHIRKKWTLKTIKKDKGHSHKDKRISM